LVILSVKHSMPKRNYFSKHTRQSGDGAIKIVMPYSYGKSVPRGGSLEACLCKNELTYSRKCCEGYLINQGIGNITGTVVVVAVGNPWSSAFSNAFGPLTP
jgi:hypothetical protein